MLFPDTGIIDLHVDERINQSETLYLTVRASDPKALELKADVELALPNGRRYFIVDTYKSRDGAQALVTVQAEASWTKLADSKHIGTLAFAGNNLADVLEFVVDLKDFQGWTYALDGVSPTTSISFEANDASMLDLIRKCAQVARCEVHFDTATNVVTFVDELGTDRGLAFTYARNLNTVARRENPPKVTRLWPFGKDGLTIAAVEPDDLPYIEDFGFYTSQGITEDQARARYLKEHIWKDDKYITAQTLYDAAQDVLAELADASINYELGVTDLTALTQITEDDYVIGDTVLTTDSELHFTNVRTRVVRIDRYPLEPWRTELELSFLPVVAPDPAVGDARNDTRLEWNLFASRNTDTNRYVGAVRTVLNRLVVNTITGAEWIVAYSLNAVATGTGTITLEALDTISGDPIAPPVTLDVTSGDPVHWAFSFGELNVAPGQYNLIVRAEGNSGGELDIAELGTALYVLARGTTQQDLTLIDSIRFDYTGAIQEFEVPDDVSEVRIECHGAEGGQNGTETPTPALGGMMAANFTVLPGEIYDVYVGGWTNDNLGESNTGGWPDGGDTHDGSGAAGGGSSQVRPDGGAIATALLIAGGGGGKGSGDIIAFGDIAGGGGGYPEGIEAPGVIDADGANSGGTQTTGGDGAGTTAFGNGAQGAGGDTVSDSESPAEWVGSGTTCGGGGGGGWYGGGGGGFGRGARGGGGGSGYVGDGAYDLEVINNENAGPGYVIISWQNPLDT